MSDLDTLIVTFQTQLSDVMETVVKTAMYEVTRLVEDGFLEEVKRRKQEVESLRMQLQWAENKLSDQDGKENKSTCFESDAEDLDLFPADTSEERPSEQQQGNLSEDGVKTEGDSLEKWTRSCRREAASASLRGADDSTVNLSERTSEVDYAPEKEHVLPDKDVKEELVKKVPCCSELLSEWSPSFNAEAGPKPNGRTETSEAQPKQTQEYKEELLKDVTQMDLEDGSIGTDQLNNDWANLTVRTCGLLQNHRLAADKDCDPVQTRGHFKHTEHKVSNSVSVDVCAPVTPERDQIPGSPKARVRNGPALGVTIKQEVIADSYGCEVTEHRGKKRKKTGMVPLLCSVKQHNRLSSEAQTQDHASHKASAQEVVKLHSKLSTSLRLQAALQHFHRPMKKPSQILSNSTTAALSAAHSQVVNINRLSSPSKAVQSLPLSGQRVQLGDKQSGALRRAGEPWVSIKTLHQSVTSHHTEPLSEPDSLPHAGPRNLLRCGQCGKCFPHPSNLKAHLQTHTGERPFCCTLCGRSFTKLSNLKAHRRVHTGERPYCCLSCGKRFTQKCNLKRHQRIHLDV